MYWFVTSTSKLGKVSNKKIVDNSTKPPPPPVKIYLAKNDLHAMKQILNDTGPQLVEREK